MDMNVKLMLLDGMLSNGPIKDAVAGKVEQDEEFKRILEEFDASQETDEQRAKRKANEAKAAQEKRDVQKRSGELYARIAQLRQKISNSGGSDKVAAAELSMAQTELFWLLCGM